MIEESFSVSDLARVIENARGSGFVGHDIRDPERFESESDTAKIREIDKAFLKAADSLNLPFWQMAAYAESGVSLEDTDKLADVVVDPNNTDNDKIEFKQGTNVYETAFRWYRGRMGDFAKGLKDDVAQQAENYWEKYAS